MSLKGVREGAKAVGHAHRSVKIFFATLACFFMAGLLLFSTDPEITEEVPYREAIAAAFLVFGVLLLLVTIAGDSAFGRRLKGLLGGLAAFAIVAGGLYVLVPAATRAWTLSSRGKQATVPVQRTRLGHRGKKVVTQALVTVEGTRSWIDVRGGRGPRVAVVYDPEDPKTVVAGEKGTFVDLIDRGLGKWWALGIGVLVVFTFFAGLVGFKRFLLGAPAPPPDPERG